MQLILQTTIESLRCDGWSPIVSSPLPIPDQVFYPGNTFSYFAPENSLFGSLLTNYTYEADKGERDETERVGQEA